jgi:hypothetical protein
MWWTTLLLALREIRRNALRSTLTILGIVIGVAAVIVMVTLGDGATLAVRTQIESLGSNLLVIRTGQHMGPGQTSNAPLRPGGRLGRGPRRVCGEDVSLGEPVHDCHRRQQQLGHIDNGHGQPLL